jgi:6-phosphogluconolactonase/glucosamine-6-phosphate isomerase/deaminase
MTQYIKSENYKKGSEDLANAIITELKLGKKVLWFLTGGSSIPSCADTLNILKNSGLDLKNITVTLTDERYGEVGHADSSWQRLIVAGFDFDVVNAIPVLVGESFEETSEIFEINIIKAFAENDIIISQFGIGSDLHIAGIIPESPAVLEKKLVSHYATETFDRITLSLEGIKKINSAYVFIFGEVKKKVIKELQINTESLPLKPANILRFIPEVFIYSDQIE